MVGAIDLSVAEKTFVAVSQTSSDTNVQAEFAKATGAGAHMAWTPSVSIPGTSEGSQRARSLGFFGFGLIAATSTEAYEAGGVTELHASENGLISLNPALTPARVGSCSTRTTHPAFIAALQHLFSRLELNVVLKNFYQLKTKGEMFRECTDQDLLKNLLPQSMSCGKSGRIHQHCGRCVPCLIRRSAFHASGIDDSTDYKCRASKTNKEFVRSDDVRCAFLGSSNHSDDEWIARNVSPSLHGADIAAHPDFLNTAKRGLHEVYNYLKDVV